MFVQGQGFEEQKLLLEEHEKLLNSEIEMKQKAATEERRIRRASENNQ